MQRTAKGLAVGLGCLIVGGLSVLSSAATPTSGNDTEAHLPVTWTDLLVRADVVEPELTAEGYMHLEDVNELIFAHDDVFSSAYAKDSGTLVVGVKDGARGRGDELLASVSGPLRVESTTVPYSARDLMHVTGLLADLTLPDSQFRGSSVDPRTNRVVIYVSRLGEDVVDAALAVVGSSAPVLFDEQAGAGALTSGP